MWHVRARGTQAAALYGLPGNQGQRDSYIDPRLGQAFVSFPGNDFDGLGARPYRSRQGGDQGDAPMGRGVSPKVLGEPIKPQPALLQGRQAGAHRPGVYQGYRFPEPMRAHNGCIQQDELLERKLMGDSDEVSEVDSDDEDCKDWRKHPVSPPLPKMVFYSRQWEEQEPGAFVPE